MRCGDAIAFAVLGNGGAANDSCVVASLARSSSSILALSAASLAASAASAASISARWHAQDSDLQEQDMSRRLLDRQSGWFC